MNHELTSRERKLLEQISAGKRNKIVRLASALLLFALLLSGRIAAHATAIEKAYVHRISAAQLLRPDGSLDVPKGFTGSLDMSGYTMSLGVHGEPHFAHEGNAPNVDDDKHWDDQFGFPGIGGEVYAIAVQGSDVFVAGFFIEAANTLPTDGIARWDGRRWHDMGGNTDLFVKALAADENYVYAGGNFTVIGGAPAKGIARWSRSTGVWSALGSGIGLENAGEEVRAIVLVGDDVYVGGSFKAMDGVTAPGIAKFNTTSNQWSGLGRGIGSTFSTDPNETIDGGGSTVYGLAAGTGNKLYVGGVFNTAGNATNLKVSNIAMWDIATSQWSGLGTGVVSASDSNIGADVKSLGVLGNDVYVTGSFVKAGGATARHAAKWNGSQWSALGTGLNGDGFSLAIAGGMVYVGGSFSAVGATSAWNVARWDPTTSTWAALGQGVSIYYPSGSAGQVNALATTSDGNGVFAGGSFSYADLMVVNHIARWDGTNWNTLGKGSQGFNSLAGTGHIYAVGLAGDGKVYVGGDFRYLQGKPFTNAAAWDGVAWSGLGAGIGIDSAAHVRAITIVGTDVYFGGKFTKAGGLAANNLARWDTTSQTWSALGSGVNDEVFALVADPYANNTLLAGGKFSSAGSLATGPLARFDPTSNTWSAVVANLTKTVLFYAIYAILPAKDDIVVGGNFDGIKVNGTEIRMNSFFFVTRSDSKPHALDGGVPKETVWGKIYAMAVTASGDLYIGGEFDTAGSSSAHNIARLGSNGKWVPAGDIGGGNFSRVQALIANGDTLYAGGMFRAAGTADASCIARHDGTSDEWSAMGSGIYYDDNTTAEYTCVDALEIADGGIVFAGGYFYRAGNHPAGSFGVYTDTVMSNPQPTPTVTITPNPNLKPLVYLPLVVK